MIKIFEHSNVLDTGPGIIVHQANCQCVFGSGIALEIKNRFPAVFEHYKAEHDARGLKLGTIQVIEVGHSKYIVNAMAQNLYGAGQRQTSYDALTECFEQVNEFALALGQINNELPVIRFPLIGAVRGGGKWPIIESIIEASLDSALEKELHLFP